MNLLPNFLKTNLNDTVTRSFRFCEAAAEINRHRPPLLAIGSKFSQHPYVIKSTRRPDLKLIVSVVPLRDGAKFQRPRPDCATGGSFQTRFIRTTVWAPAAKNVKPTLFFATIGRGGAPRKRTTFPATPNSFVRASCFTGTIKGRGKGGGQASLRNNERQKQRAHRTS